MTARLLYELLPIELIEKIQAYQIPEKDGEFIVRWMQRLSNMTVNQQQLTYWRFLVRDSEHLIIQLPTNKHQQHEFNFTDFVQNFIKKSCKNQYIKDLCKYFEVFCKNAVKKNPYLLENNRKSIIEKFPCWKMIQEFLLIHEIQWTKITVCQEVEDALFSIYQSFMKQHSDSLLWYQSFYYFDRVTYGTKYVVNVIKIIFQRLSKFLLNANLGDYYSTGYVNPQKIVITFLRSLFQKLSYPQNHEEKIMIQLLFQRKVYQEDLTAQQLAIRRKTIQRILQYFQDKHAAILEKYKKYIIKEAIHLLNLKTLQYVMALPGFRSLVFSKEYVFHLVESRKFKLFRLLWSVEEQRGTLCSFKSNGRNILETAAENRGLSHNFIDLLWASKSFETLPNIKNQKSKAIIHQRYGIKQEEQSMV